MTAITTTATGSVNEHSTAVAEPEGGYRPPFMEPDGGYRPPFTEPDGGWGKPRGWGRGG